MSPASTQTHSNSGKRSRRRRENNKVWQVEANKRQICNLFVLHRRSHPLWALAKEVRIRGLHGKPSYLLDGCTCAGSVLPLFICMDSTHSGSVDQCILNVQTEIIQRGVRPGSSSRSVTEGCLDDRCAEHSWVRYQGQWCHCLCWARSPLVSEESS